MRVYFFIFFILFIKCVRSEVLSYINCEKTTLEVNKVIFGDCRGPPCHVGIREMQNISLELNSDESVPPFKSMSTIAQVSVMNVNWPLRISPDNPCEKWKCPLDGRIQDKQFNATIDFRSINIYRPGRLRILGIDDESKPTPINIFCVEFNIDLNST